MYHLRQTKRQCQCDGRAHCHSHTPKFCLLSSWQTHHFIASQSAHRSYLMRDTTGSFREYHKREEVLSAPIFYRKISCLTFLFSLSPAEQYKERCLFHPQKRDDGSSWWHHHLMLLPTNRRTSGRRRDTTHKKPQREREREKCLDVISWEERDHDMRVVEGHAILFNCLIPPSIPRHPRFAIVYRQVMQCPGYGNELHTVEKKN